MTNKLFRAALATGKRVRTETAISAGRASVASVAVDAARDGDRRPRRAPRADRRRRGDGRADRAGAARPGRHARCSWPTAAASARSPSPSASAARRGRSTRCPPSSSGPTSSSPRPPRRTRSSAPRSSTRSCAPAAAGRCCSSTSPCRATSTRTARELAGVTLLDMDALQHRVERHLSVRQRRGAPRRGDRRGGDPGLRGLARLAGGARRPSPRCAPAATRWSPACWRRTPGAGRGSRERDRERVELLARAVVNRLLHEPTLRVKGLEPEQRHARLQLLRELFGLEEAPAEAAAQPAEVRALRPR